MRGGILTVKGRDSAARVFAIEADEPLVEIESEKATLEVPSPGAGVLKKIARKRGEVVAIGDVLADSDDAAKPAAGGKGKGKAAPPAAGSLAGRPAVRIVVADHGPGIGAEHLPRLTERFFRVDTARSRQLGGTGLGLAIVKHILRRHRGHLAIASELGRGTTVTAYLPADDGRSPAQAESPTATRA